MAERGGSRWGASSCSRTLLRVLAWIIATALIGLGSPTYAVDDEVLNRLFREGQLRQDDYTWRIWGLTISTEPLYLNMREDESKDTLWLRVNSLPRAGYVNVYFLSRQQLAAVGVKSECNCRAIKEGERRYIFCDAENMKSKSVEFSREYLKSEQPIPNADIAFLLWVISHEMAHHHYDHPSILGLKYSSADHRKFEREADIFAGKAFAYTPLRKAVFDVYFSGASKRLESIGWLGSIWSYMREVGTTHGDLTTRFKLFASLLADMYSDGASYRRLEPNTVRLSDDCAYAEPPTPAFDLQNFINQWLLLDFQERQILAPYAIRMLNGASGDDESELNKKLGTLVLCQALILAKDSDKCEFSFSGGTDVEAIKEWNVDLTNLLMAQNLILSHQADAEVLRDFMLRSAWAYAGYFHKRLNWGQGSPAYSFLAWLGGRATDSECGDTGYKLVAQPEYSCQLLSQEVARELQIPDYTEFIVALNVLMALNIQDFPQSNAAADLMAVLAIQDELYGTEHILTQRLDDLRRQTENSNIGRNLFVAFAFQHLGQRKLARKQLERVSNAIAASDLEFNVKVQTFFEMAGVCAEDYEITCAERHYNTVLGLLKARSVVPNSDEAAFVADRIGSAEFEVAWINIVRAKTAPALAILQRQLAEAKSAVERIAILETIAEAYIQDGNGQAAADAMAQALALIDKEGPRDYDRRFSTLSYLTATAYLNKNWGLALTRLQEMNEMYEKRYLHSLLGAAVPFAIGRRLIPADDLYSELEQKALGR